MLMFSILKLKLNAKKKKRKEKEENVFLDKTGSFKSKSVVSLLIKLLLLRMILKNSIVPSSRIHLAASFTCIVKL